jgi:hypothetical protein
MQYAQIQVLPPTPPGGVTVGIDWATADHVACVVDSAGRVLDRISAAHDRAGIRKLVSALRAGSAAEVAIERGDGVLVDALLAAGLTVVVIKSRQVKNLRSRYGSSGAKDDRFDAFVLADVLRTDRARLRPLVPDSPATLALRAAVRARRDLVAHRVAACNQLRGQDRDICRAGACASWFAAHAGVAAGSGLLRCCSDPRAPPGDVDDAPARAVAGRRRTRRPAPVSAGPGMRLSWRRPPAIGRTPPAMTSPLWRVRSPGSCRARLRP